MSGGLRALRRIQIGREYTGGPPTKLNRPGNRLRLPPTPATVATNRIIGTLGMQNDQKYYRPDDLETGRLSSYERSFVVGEIASLPFAADANFEQLSYFLGMTIIGGTTGNLLYDGRYQWVYIPYLTFLDSPDTYSIWYGDDIQAFKSTYCWGKDIELSGAIDDVVKIKSNIVGQNVRADSWDALDNPYPITPIIAGLGTIWVDAAMVDVGTTQVHAILVDFTWKVTDGVVPIKYIDGNIFYSDQTEKKRHVELEATLAFNSDSAAYFANYIASSQTPLAIRLDFKGPPAGDLTDNNELILDGNFVIDEFPTLTERDGQDIVKLKMVSKYDYDSNLEFAIGLYNDVAALL